MATIFIPTPLRKFTNNSSKLQLQGATVKELIDELALNFPDLKKHVLDDAGNIRSFVNIFVDNDDIRNLQQENTVVSETAQVSLVPAIAGGASIKF